MAGLSASRAVGSRMAKLTKEIGTARRTAVERGAFEAKKHVAAEIRQATGGDNRLSGVGVKGARVGVRYDIKGTDNPTALVRATGPLHLVENPVKAHEIKPKRRRGKTKKAVVTPAGPRASVQHPGVKSPKRPWSKGVDRAVPHVRREVGGVFSAAFARGATR